MLDITFDHYCTVCQYFIHNYQHNLYSSSLHIILILKCFELLFNSL